MITIYYDFQQTQQIKPDEYTWLAKQVRDYVPLRQHLHQVLNDTDHNYVIYIQSRILARWLDDLRDYSPNIMRWEEVNLREQFRQKFGFLSPPELDEKAIRDLQLLNLPLPDDVALSDTIGWMLGQCINRIWAYKRPYEGHLVDLAAWALNVKQLPLSLIPLLRERLTQWKQIDSRYQIFLELPWHDAGESLLLRWALRSYPIQFSLRQKLDLVPLEDCSRYSDLCHDLLDKHATEIKNFWTSWFMTNGLQDMKLAIRLMSGLVDIELSIFEKWAQENADTLTTSLLESVRDRFSSLPQSRTVLQQLVQLIPPPVPDIPDYHWSFEEWLGWATEKYIPYFAWVIRNQQQRDTQMEMAGCFADWLIATYPRFLFDHNAPFITNQKYQVLESLSSNQADIVLWFIVDGLTWWQGTKLSNICTERGLGITQLHPTLSALPSVTSISKRALVQGSLDSTRITQSIPQLLESLLIRDTVNAHVYTQHHQMEIDMRTKLESGLYVLLYNALDHQSHETRSFTDDESIDGHLNLITQLIEKGFQQGLKQGLNVKAFISSDHGSTLLPSSGRVLPVPNFAYAFEGEDTTEDEGIDQDQKLYHRARVCALEREPEGSSLKHIEQDWYLLRKNVFNLPLDFLIPRSYSAVGRRPKGWTHGGSTPEETVVTFIELQPSPLQVSAPTISIEGYLTPNRANGLKVKLINPNPFPLKKVQFVILDTPVNAEIGTVRPTSQVASEIEALPATSKGTTQILKWVLTCEVNGQSRRFKGDEEVPIRRLQVSAVDELFEDIL
jgi:hypothetical protein